MQLRRAIPILFLLAATLGSCMSGSRLEGAPARAENLVTWIEKVHIEANRSRDAISDGFERLHSLVSGDYPQGDIALAYAQFVQRIDVAEQQAIRFNEVVEPMESAAEPFFQEWEQSFATYGSERMRARSEMRMTVTKERFKAVLTSATDSREQLNAFVQSLRDHATFLAHDLNPSSLDEIQEDVKIVRSAAEKLDQELDRTLAAARAYVDRSAQPSQGLPAGPNR